MKDEYKAASDSVVDVKSAPPLLQGILKCNPEIFKPKEGNIDDITVEFNFFGINCLKKHLIYYIKLVLLVI